MNLKGKFIESVIFVPIGVILTIIFQNIFYPPPPPIPEISGHSEKNKAGEVLRLFGANFGKNSGTVFMISDKENIIKDLKKIRNWDNTKIDVAIPSNTKPDNYKFQIIRTDNVASPKFPDIEILNPKIPLDSIAFFGFYVSQPEQSPEITSFSKYLESKISEFLEKEKKNFSSIYEKEDFNLTSPPEKLNQATKLGREKANIVIWGSIIPNGNSGMSAMLRLIIDIKENFPINGEMTQNRKEHEVNFFLPRPKFGVDVALAKIAKNFDLEIPEPSYLLKIINNIKSGEKWKAGFNGPDRDILMEDWDFAREEVENLPESQKMEAFISFFLDDSGIRWLDKYGIKFNRVKRSLSELFFDPQNREQVVEVKNYAQYLFDTKSFSNLRSKLFFQMLRSAHEYEFLYSIGKKSCDAGEMVVAWDALGFSAQTEDKDLLNSIIKTIVKCNLFDSKYFIENKRHDPTNPSWTLSIVLDGIQKHNTKLPQSIILEIEKAYVVVQDYLIKKYGKTYRNIFSGQQLSEDSKKFLFDDLKKVLLWNDPDRFLLEIVDLKNPFIIWQFKNLFRKNEISIKNKKGTGISVLNIAEFLIQSKNENKIKLFKNTLEHFANPEHINLIGKRNVSMFEEEEAIKILVRKFKSVKHQHLLLNFLGAKNLAYSSTICLDIEKQILGKEKESPKNNRIWFYMDSDNETKEDWLKRVGIRFKNTKADYLNYTKNKKLKFDNSVGWFR